MSDRIQCIYILDEDANLSRFSLDLRNYKTNVNFEIYTPIP